MVTIPDKWVVDIIIIIISKDFLITKVAQIITTITTRTTTTIIKELLQLRLIFLSSLHISNNSNKCQWVLLIRIWVKYLQAIKWDSTTHLDNLSPMINQTLQMILSIRVTRDNLLIGKGINKINQVAISNHCKKMILKWNSITHRSTTNLWIHIDKYTTALRTRVILRMMNHTITIISRSSSITTTIIISKTVIIKINNSIMIIRQHQMTTANRINLTIVHIQTNLTITIQSKIIITKMIIAIMDILDTATTTIRVIMEMEVIKNNKRAIQIRMYRLQPPRTYQKKRSSNRFLKIKFSNNLK